MSSTTKPTGASSIPSFQMKPVPLCFLFGIYCHICCEALHLAKYGAINKSTGTAEKLIEARPTDSCTDLYFENVEYPPSLLAV